MLVLSRKKQEAVVVGGGVGLKAEDKLRFDLEAETDTIHHFRQRVQQCETLGKYAIAEHIRGILVQAEDHQVALAIALDVEVSNATRARPHRRAFKNQRWIHGQAVTAGEDNSQAQPLRTPKKLLPPPAATRRCM